MRVAPSFRQMDYRPLAAHNARMNAILYDTLLLSHTLRDRGHFTPEQAEALAEALGAAQHGDLVTKADLAAVEGRLKAKITKLEASLEARMGVVETKIGNLATKAELADVRADILKWIVGTIGFQSVVMVGALITLVRLFAK